MPSSLLSFSGQRKNLLDDISRLVPYVNDDALDVVDRITPLLKIAFRGDCDDARISKSCLSRRCRRDTSTASPGPDLTRFTTNRNTSSFANSSEYRINVDGVPREELDAMYVDLPRFHEFFFGDVAGLEAASEAIFDKCQESDSPLVGPGDR
ncbi:hypothetical protein M431DRAFT_489455 [Trichoderma harzianum CBS 226.95]|uniref:Uncharacterized protein n=1 Tax=Trichoderma harzianum CBS 226.95 TaxID=983964 RepID=A0A2T4AUG4_TRIHA|nr:hypothetical protein M431DRAFT_489455 [Trichoderma harzianum CBS 226.95]PTB60681.1 hypothetical protein M431DRAFT_489455 [Trichoderma harzianum CBS 226.95]